MNFEERIFYYYNSIGKESIKATSSDFTSSMGEDGVKDIIRKVLIGGNVRDTTEFITQRRLLNSYFAMLDLYMNHLKNFSDDSESFAEYVTDDLKDARDTAKVLDLWLLGLTKKGFDNIVRGPENILDYQVSFAQSMNDAIEDLEDTYGEMSGTIELDGKKLDVNWNTMALLFMALGGQTLSIRGSSKSMNGKMFEKLVLGSLLTINGFEYVKEPPINLDKNKKYFWLSHMDENERETDATIVYNGKAISIDIGFIGKGNPEITLDKVTRFGAYKRIGGIEHDMATIIIVDTVAPNSDLFNKASRVNGHVFQMKNKDWTIEVAKTICSIMGVKNELSQKSISELDSFYQNALKGVNVEAFVN